ncbi:MAG: tetratricopeptide repeat protein, partial [Vicinamibacteria bacterium]
GDDIVSQIAEAFDTRAAGTQTAPSPQGEAYESYLKGRYFWNRRTAEGLRRAIEYFQRAIEIAPDYAQAHTGLADANLLLVEYAGAPPREAAVVARKTVLRALELDESLASAHASLGGIHFLFDWDADAAEGSFRRALELTPGYATAHHWFALHLAACRRFDEALSEIRLAQRGDPLSPILYAAAGWIAYGAGRPEMAVTEAQRSFELHPEFAQGHLVLGLARLRMGQSDPALGALERAVAMSGQQPRVLGLLGYAYGLAGETGAARAVLDQLDVLAESSYVPASRVAFVHGSLGDVGRMREWIDRAIEGRDMLLPYAPAILSDRPSLAAVLEESGFSYPAR